MASAEIGIIGGTGVYDPEILKDKEEVEVQTPYGKPSDRIVLGVLEGRRVAILPRHGKNHTIPPHKLNFKANIDALKQLGVTRIIATAAVGSLKEDLKPGVVVIPDQFVDFSRQVHSFYEGQDGKVYHVSLADPFCQQLNITLEAVLKRLEIPHNPRGVYVKIDGPQFSTRAASRMYRQVGDIIGMTAVPEAILAREREVCFSTIATVTDYDVWAERPVNIQEILKVMKENLDKTKAVIREAIRELPKERACVCKDALKDAGV